MHSSARVFHRFTTLRCHAIKNGVEQGHWTQSNGLGIKDLWLSDNRPPRRPFRSSERPGGPRVTGKPTIPGRANISGSEQDQPASPPCPQSVNGRPGRLEAAGREPGEKRGLSQMRRTGADSFTSGRNSSKRVATHDRVEVAAELLADVEEQIVRSVHQAQRPGRESPQRSRGR